MYSVALPEQKMKILIVKLSSLGDVIHTLPVLSSLKQRFPESHITWLIEEQSVELLRDHPFVDKVLVFPKNRWMGALTRFGSIPGCLQEISRFISDIRADHYDVVLDFQGLLKSGVFIGLVRAKQKWGFFPGREKSHIFLSDRVPYPSGPLHSVERYLTLIEALGCERQPPKFVIPIRQSHRTTVWAFFEKHAIDPNLPLVLLHPGTRWETKMWEESKWARLADILQAEYGCTILFTGNEREASMITRIAGSMRTAAINTAGMWSLNELAFLQAQATVVVTPDSGPMHLAASLGTPVIALFGPTDPVLTGPYGTGHTIITKDVDCRPCFKRQCSSKECMTGITPEGVCDGVSSYLRSSEDPHCVIQ
jgi:3-deoxy-D-manno-octulosonic-acid transferase/heptosyltransferase-1